MIKSMIRTLGGFINITGDECLEMQKIIDKEFEELFSNLNSCSSNKSSVYKTGNSKQIQTNYVFG